MSTFEPFFKQKFPLSPAGRGSKGFVLISEITSKISKPWHNSLNISSFAHCVQFEVLWATGGVAPSSNPIVYMRLQGCLRACEGKHPSIVPDLTINVSGRSRSIPMLHFLTNAVNSRSTALYRVPEENLYVVDLTVPFLGEM